MKIPMFSVRDALNGFGAPIQDSNKESAIRNFKYAVTNNNVMNFMPSDYDLYYVGEWDCDLGTFVSIVPELVMRGSECIGS